MVTQSMGALPLEAAIEKLKSAPIPAKKTYAGEFVELNGDCVIRLGISASKIFKEEEKVQRVDVTISI